MRVRVASAGTGKTTSLVLRLLALVGEGVPLRRIAAVTYTRTAAAELRQRVGEGIRALLDDGAYLGGLLRLDPRARPRFEEAERELGGATMATIHGFLMIALRQVAPSLGLDPDFAPFGEGEARSSYEEELRGIASLARDPRHPLADAWARLGDAAPTDLLALFEQRSLAYDLRPVDGPSADLRAVHEVAYERWLARMGPARLAPSEIELQALRAMSQPALAARVVERSSVVLVDEFQDVNPLQGRLFDALERAGSRIEVVGDPKQSIYGFRHADVEVFRRAAAAAVAAGTLDAPLLESRRHAPVIVALLNLLTGRLAQDGLGFEPEEAPDVRAVGADAAGPGRVELHWWRDDEAEVAALRSEEFAGLADRLRGLADDGRAWGEMAVLAPTHASLASAEAALRAAGVPTVLRQGRGYFERAELRDLMIAVRVAIDPRGLALAAFLRGPFGRLPVAVAVGIAGDHDPAQALRERAPEVASRVDALRRELLADPANAIAHLAYTPLIDGAPYVAGLTARARDNVDALVVTLSERPAGDLERLLDHVARLARESDAGDLPQAGDGVTLLTVHAAKGLEWPLVAVIDAGRGRYAPSAPLVIDAQDGLLARRGSEAYDVLERDRRRRAEGEAWRALYVAVSRPRQVLLVTGSQGREGPGPWLRAFHLVGLGPRPAASDAGVPPNPLDGAVARALGVRVVQHGSPSAAPPAAAPRSVAPPALAPRSAAAAPPPRAPLPAAPWAGRVPRPARFPAVVSPSWVALEGAGRAPEARVRAAWPAPLVAPDPDGDDWREPDAGGERLAGRGTVVGILVHDALARGRRVEGPAEREALAVQAVLFPFPPEARAGIIDEVVALVAGFWRLVDAGELPAPGTADLDRSELPFVFEAGGSVWQGVIDRLVRHGERWWLDDYKTDRRLDPERYVFSLATYVRAVELVHGVRPAARLVDLRQGRLVVLPDPVLLASWESVVGG